VPETVDLRRLLPIGADDANAGEVLLGERRQLAKVLLNRLETVMNGPSHAGNDRGEQCHREQREHR
jgi:hypothetical protein